MRIGELAEQTGTPPRMLRYYEQQGLLEAGRQTNGYRDFPQSAVERVGQIRGLIDAGVPTLIIEQLLPCLGASPDIILHDDCPEILAVLEQQRDQLTSRIECLTRNRDAIGNYVQTIRTASSRAASP